MNLEEIKSTIATMQRLRRAQNDARINLINFLCGNDEVYKELQKQLGDAFGLEKLRWKHSLENSHGTDWANVFAFMSDDPSDEQILDNLFTLTTREPQVYAKMIDHFEAYEIEEKIKAAEFVAKYKFPNKHHTWITYRLNKKNAAVTADPSLFDKVERTLRQIWGDILDYIIVEEYANWKGEEGFEDRFTDAYETMTKTLIPPCINLSERYISALAWMSEYEATKNDHVTTMTMDKLENCNSVL